MSTGRKLVAVSHIILQITRPMLTLDTVYFIVYLQINTKKSKI
jgi:hypothetical protein